MHTTIITLHKQGTSQRQIAKAAGIDRKTVRRIIKKYTLQKIEAPSPMVRKSALEPWHQQIVGFLESNLSYVRILEELRALGYNLSYSSLTRYIGKHHIKRETCIRFHTQPGEEAQVDFGDIGKRADPSGRMRKAYVFNMRLSYSRYDYYEIVFDQKISTWIKCHINAFLFFGGVPEYVKLDNLKAGILKAEFYESTFQADYKRLADHYGFHISPCRVREPQEKGKVESGIKYIKNNFLMCREFRDNSDMTYKLSMWLEAANKRIHGTTKKIPMELFKASEKQHLRPLPSSEFDMATWHMRKVAKDCHITVDNNYYSVPSSCVGMDVGILLSSNLLKIYAGEEVIATHARSKGAGVFTTITSHYAKGKLNCPGFIEFDEKIESQLSSIGKNAKALLILLKKDHKKDWARAARGIISLTKIYSNELIDKAAKRALCYGVSSYGKIKSILESNSQNLPLPDADINNDYSYRHKTNTNTEVNYAKSA